MSQETLPNQPPPAYTQYPPAPAHIQGPPAPAYTRDPQPPQQGYPARASIARVSHESVLSQQQPPKPRSKYKKRLQFLIALFYLNEIPSWETKQDFYI